MNDARLISIAAQIEACGSDQLKLTALANSLREEAQPTAQDKADFGFDLPEEETKGLEEFVATKQAITKKKAKS